MLFATPDFGASGYVALFLLGICLAVLCVCISLIARGVVLRRTSAHRWSGGVLIAAGLLLPVCCWIGPSVLFRLYYRTAPLSCHTGGRLKEGMSPDEVRAALGKPHTVNDEDPERVEWYYWLDAIRLHYVKVVFGPDGKLYWADRD